MQALSLQLIAPLSQKNALAIMQEFSPRGMAIKQGKLLVLTDAGDSTGDLINKVKTGAYEQLKNEVFQILNPPDNFEALLERCDTVFRNKREVLDFFAIGKKQEKKETDRGGLQEGKKEQHSQDNLKIDLLESVSEPSRKIEVEFEDSPQEPIPTLSSPQADQHFCGSVEIEEFCPSAEVVTGQCEQTQFFNCAPDTQEQKKNEVPEKAEDEEKEQKNEEISVKTVQNVAEAVSFSVSDVKGKSASATSACLTAILLLWIIWLIL